MKKKWPVLSSDDEAASFVAEADLTDYDFSEMVPMRFELRRKDKTVSLRLSEDLLIATKRAAARQGVPYQRFMRHAIEQATRAAMSDEHRGDRDRS